MSSLPLNVTRATDGRQDPTSQDLELQCPVCVQSGMACQSCGNSFVLYDLRIFSTTGTAEHLTCAVATVKEKWTGFMRADLLSLGEKPETEFGRRLMSDGQRLVTHASSLMADGSSDFQRGLCVARAAYYQRDLVSMRGHPQHVAGADDRSCDFCQAPEVARRFSLPAFHHTTTPEPGELPLRYEGDWTACAVCAEAVKNKDVATLVRRGLTQPASDLPKKRRRRHYERLYGRVVASIKESAL